MTRKIIFAVLIASLMATLIMLAGCSGSTGGSSVRMRSSLGYGFYRHGYGPWGPCRFDCRPPIIIEGPRPELPIEPPEFEAVPLPDMDFDVGDFAEW